METMIIIADYLKGPNEIFLSFVYKIILVPNFFHFFRSFHHIVYSIKQSKFEFY
jgi:hypothetical protein